ncbi:MAG TPA: trehalose-phosphatase, partial [Puia sp.]|nr:trehalose-phosphatase [Puia sp.]
SIVWHYRNADPQLADRVKTDLCTELSAVDANRFFRVTTGKKIVEVRSSEIDKGSMVSRLLAQDPGDFILAIGDDRTDEDMFRSLAKSEHTFTIKVGHEASHALFNLHTPQSVISLLSTLGHLKS